MVNRAIEVAAKAHRNQVRKGTDIPYIAHPYAVGLMLARSGCSDEVVAAGILHDTIEDTELTEQDLRREFGEEVASIVVGCSEPDRSHSWEERKEHTLAYMPTAPWEVRAVSCADKLHNLLSIEHGYQTLSEEVWNSLQKRTRPTGMVLSRHGRCVMCPTPRRAGCATLSRASRGGRENVSETKLKEEIPACRRDFFF